MKYFVTISGRTLEVRVDGDRVVVDGASLEAHLAAVPGTPLHHLLLDGASWTMAVHPAGAAAGPRWSWVIGAVGERFAVDVVDERTRAIEALTGARASGGGAGTVVAPMPGLVVRLEVREGQRVEAGAGLVVVEAMKMENELRAPRAGVVAAVHARVGQAVEKGAALVTLVAGPEPSS
ncbi:MAG: acetyl-CoA carboxylase biotin carboxyl carrier protein subunit [Gemmatimonadales bacterium]